MELQFLHTQNGNNQVPRGCWEADRSCAHAEHLASASPEKRKLCAEGHGGTGQTAGVRIEHGDRIALGG